MSARLAVTAAAHRSMLRRSAWQPRSSTSSLLRADAITVKHRMDVQRGITRTIAAGKRSATSTTTRARPHNRTNNGVVQLLAPSRGSVYAPTAFRRHYLARSAAEWRASSDAVGCVAISAYSPLFPSKQAFSTTVVACDLVARATTVYVSMHDC
jgi:hypothetical protein